MRIESFIEYLQKQNMKKPKKGTKFMKKKNTEKKIKSSVYYDKDVSEMLQTMTEKYHLSRNRIHNIVLRKYLPDAMIWS